MISYMNEKEDEIGEEQEEYGEEEIATVNELKNKLGHTKEKEKNQDSANISNVQLSRESDPRNPRFITNQEPNHQKIQVADSILNQGLENTSNHLPGNSFIQQSEKEEEPTKWKKEKNDEIKIRKINKKVYKRPSFFYNKTGDSMEFKEVLRKRRSIRKYLSKEVKKEDIEKIIEAGSLAPSAHFKEPWEILVVKKKKQKIAHFLEEYGKHETKDISLIKTAHTIENCDTILLIYCTDFEQETYNLLSMGAMIENMLLKATDLGIGSLWIGNVCSVEHEINTYFQVDSEKQKLVSAVALGYPLTEPKEIIRKNGSEITRYIDCD